MARGVVGILIAAAGMALIPQSRPYPAVEAQAVSSVMAVPGVPLLPVVVVAAAAAAAVFHLVAVLAMAEAVAFTALADKVQTRTDLCEGPDKVW